MTEGHSRGELIMVWQWGRGERDSERERERKKRRRRRRETSVYMSADCRSCSKLG